MLSTIHQLSTHYLMRATFPNALGKDEETYVEYGFARFADSSTKTVVVDEPLVLLAATHWLNRVNLTRGLTCYKYFAKKIHNHDPLSNGFENYIAFCLDLAFSSSRVRCIKDLFTFHSPPPPWADLPFRVVALHRTSVGSIEQSAVRHFEFSGPSLTLGVNAKSPEETTAWLEFRKNAAMCFPHTSMGPDMMLVLKLEDGSCIWVAVQAKYTQGRNGSITRPVLRQAMRSVTPEFFFVDKVRESAPMSLFSLLTHRIHLVGRTPILSLQPSQPLRPNAKSSQVSPKPTHRRRLMQPPARHRLLPSGREPQEVS